MLYRILWGTLFVGLVQAVAAQAEAELRAQVQRLERELAEAKSALAVYEGKGESVKSAEVGTAGAEQSEKISLGEQIPWLEGLTFGGAIRVNYFWGDYIDDSPGTSSDAAGNGTIALDTFRVNLDYERGPWLGKFEYRFYEGYNTNDSYSFLHTGWLGYEFANSDQLQIGVNRVPFGPRAYGVSQSWFFDQHYYVGLADDMDLGIKYQLQRGDLSLDLAYYYSDEGTWSGSSKDSSRYSYDVVNETGDGYEERNQFNLRVIYAFDFDAVELDLGGSAQYGQLESRGVQDDGHHYALSVHPVFRVDNWTLATQLTYYEFAVDDTPTEVDGTDRLVQLGAYDFPTEAAAEAWIGAVSLSYKYETPGIAWLDYVLPYIEYSSIMKEESEFNDSELMTVGAAWARGGWYIYTEMATSNGNDFVGNESGFDSRFGANPDDDWETRYNINIGYYY
ncbi:MAG: hypothetical protein ACPGJU_05690 [Coraliomargarita sp.]